MLFFVTVHGNQGTNKKLLFSAHEGTVLPVGRKSKEWGQMRSFPPVQARQPGLDGREGRSGRGRKAEKRRESRKPGRETADAGTPLLRPGRRPGVGHRAARNSSVSTYCSSSASWSWVGVAAGGPRAAASSHRPQCLRIFSMTAG